ncbi:MAG: hypothetical protein PWP03_510 [Candidatus Woesearchaeota archaeon]|nr:hypothetical protein [Candidatus Woesearchaeota archaeon]MDN5327872.1 hypothetical protein [Candidatus Woesearchaeota archaeon]
MKEYLISIGVTFILLLILAELTLIVKRIKINSRLERETKEEMKRITTETKKNKHYLKRLNRSIEKVSELISFHKVSKTTKLFNIIQESYSNLSKDNKTALSDEISDVALGLFDEYFQEKLYSEARKVYDFLLEEVYPNVEKNKKREIYLELKKRYELLISTDLYHH